MNKYLTFLILSVIGGIATIIATMQSGAWPLMVYCIGMSIAIASFRERK